MSTNQKKQRNWVVKNTEESGMLELKIVTKVDPL